MILIAQKATYSLKFMTPPSACAHYLLGSPLYLRARRICYISARCWQKGHDDINRGARRKFTANTLGILYAGAQLRQDVLARKVHLINGHQKMMTLLMRYKE